MRSRITQIPRLAVTKVTPDCRGMMILLAFARSSKNAAIGSGDRQAATTVILCAWRKCAMHAADTK